MKPIYYFIAFFILLLFFTNCYYSSSDSGGGGGDDDEEEQVILPDIVTIKWGLNEGVIQFYTNDIAMLHGVNGATYWKPRSYQAAGLTEDVIEVNTCKVSGLTGYGYGLIFCIQDNPVSGQFIAKNFYCVLIRTDGFYQIIKVVEGPEAPVQHIMEIGGNQFGWKEALDASDDNVLNQGKGVDNVIRVEITDENPPSGDDVPEFHIYFNGYNIITFEDNFNDDNGVPLDIFSKADGEYKYGFIVTVSPDESFPYVPVDVRFNQITPAYSQGQFSVNNLKSKNLNTDDLFFKNSTR